MAEERERGLDIWSMLVILLTLGLFVAALFIKGLTHELLLEAGVFLVSVKLIMLSYKSSVSARQSDETLKQIQHALRRLEDRAVPPGVAGPGAAA